MAPAYDLVFSQGIAGWHTMAAAGEALDPGEAELLKVGDSCGVERRSALEILDQVREAVTRWRDFAEEMGVSGAVSREIWGRMRVV